METDPNPFPQIEIFPRVARVADFILSKLRETPQEDRGAAAMLDRELYND